MGKTPKGTKNVTPKALDGKVRFAGEIEAVPIAGEVPIKARASTPATATVHTPASAAASQDQMQRLAREAATARDRAAREVLARVNRGGKAKGA